jgi:hypothetical protein
LGLRYFGGSIFAEKAKGFAVLDKEIRAGPFTLLAKLNGPLADPKTHNGQSAPMPT